MRGQDLFQNREIPLYRIRSILFCIEKPAAVTFTIYSAVIIADGKCAGIDCGELARSEQFPQPVSSLSRFTQSLLCPFLPCQEVHVSRARLAQLRNR